MLLLEELPADLSPNLLNHLAARQEHAHLRWLHELRMGRYRDAAATLCRMADAGRVDGRQVWNITIHRYHILVYGPK